MEAERIISVGRAVIIRDEQILFVRRNGGPIGRGRWEFPGGMTKEGESDLIASMRESWEEVGLVFIPSRRLAKVTDNHGEEGPYGKATFKINYYVGEDLGGEVRLSREHDDYRWIPIGVTEDLNYTRETRGALIALSLSSLDYWLAYDPEVILPYRD